MTSCGRRRLPATLSGITTPDGRLERQLRLVELAHARGAFRFAQALAELTPISTATLTRALRELEATGMLTRMPDGAYRCGARPAGWALAGVGGVAPKIQDVLDTVRDELAATLTWWSVHGATQRCRARALHEHSPSFAEPGSLRPLTITTGGAGLAMDPAVLADLDRLRTEAKRAPLAISDSALKRLARGCLHDRVYDDRGLFYAGSRRIAVPAPDASGQPGLLALACAPAQVRPAAKADEIVSRLRQAASAIAAVPATPAVPATRADST